MARISRRRSRKRVRYFSPTTLGSSSESEGGVSGGSEDEREEAEKQERRWQLRRSTLESRAKGKQIAKEDDDEMSLSSSEDDTSGDEDEDEDGEGEGEQLQREERQQEQQQQQEAQQQEEEKHEVPHSNGATPKEQICGICLSEGGNERGKLDCCDHFFCFACIMEWSKVESRCPMCKQRFVTVMRPAVSGVSRSRTRSFSIPTRDQVYEPSEEEIRLFTDPYQNTVCTECQEAGDEGLLLLCDRCDAAAHTYCVGLGRSVPRGDWFCHACQAIEIESSEEEDGEDFTFETTDVDEEEGSGTESILAMIVGDVRPNGVSGRTRRSGGSAATSQGQVPLRRSTRRRVRRSSLSDSTALTDALMITMTSTTTRRRRYFPSLIETHQARTLSHQRQVHATVHNRLQNMRENWNRYRSGEVQFGSVGQSVESSRPGWAAGGSSSTTRLGRGTSAAAIDVNGGEAPTTSQTTRGAGRGAEFQDIEQAWVNMERAIRLEESTATPSRVTSAPDRRNGEARPQGTPVSARTRERTHQLDMMTRASSSRGAPVERSSQGDDHSRANSSRRREESRANSVMTREERHMQRRGWTDSAGEELDLSHSRSSNGRHFDRTESSRQGSATRASQSENLDILSCGADNSRSRYHLRESNRQHLSRTGNNPEDNAIGTGSLRSPSREKRNGTECLTLRSILDDKDNSRGSGGVTTRSREAKEAQMLHVQSILDDKDNSRGSAGAMTRWREAKDAQALHRRSLLDDKENSNSRASAGHTTRRESERNRSQDRGQSASRDPIRDEELKVMKAQCFDLVNNALKPILDKGTIDKNQFKELARSATHTILSSLGVPGLKQEIEAVAVGAIACDHEQPTSSSLIPGCCTPCVQRHVKRFVKGLVKDKIQLK
ncbi:unnamed protein product [Calypogeia fissa]